MYSLSELIKKYQDLVDEQQALANRSVANAEFQKASEALARREAYGEILSDLNAAKERGYI